MRKFEFTTKRETKLQNATTLGYGAWKARAGDVITYREHYKDGATGTRVARVIGEITSCDSGGEDCTGWLYVLAFGDYPAFGYARWIDPKDVIECRRVEHVRTFLTFALGASVEDMDAYCKESDIEVRRRASYSPPDEPPKK